MKDKSKELNASVRLINDKVHFTGSVEGNEDISIDYIPPVGDNKGYTSLELLLLSLSSCIGTALLTFLRKMNKNITGCVINAKGFRREEHPTGFRNILVDIQIESPDATGEDVAKVIKLAEEKYCPVYSMIKGNTDVEIKYMLK